jgi:hypothetical protein
MPQWGQSSYPRSGARNTFPCRQLEHFKVKIAFNQFVFSDFGAVSNRFSSNFAVLGLKSDQFDNTTRNIQIFALIMSYSQFFAERPLSAQFLAVLNPKVRQIPDG